MRTNVFPVAQQFLGAKKEAYQPYPHTGFLNVKIGGTLIAQFPVGSGPHSTLKSLKTPLKWYYIPMRICTISPDLGIWNFQIWTLLTTKHLQSRNGHKPNYESIFVTNWALFMVCKPQFVQSYGLQTAHKPPCLLQRFVQLRD